MARVLIIYGSEEGQTAKVAQHMAELFGSRHHAVDLVHGKQAPADLAIDSYDGVLVGASIHMGHHQKYMVDLVRRHRHELASKLSAFFTICLTAKSEAPEDIAQVQQYLQDFMQATDWYPDQVAAFAGALLYTQYGMIKRFIMRSVSKKAGGDADTSRDYEYTDWESVDDFVDWFDKAMVGNVVLADA
jgi:menaquinone-dependent protoporphyrinogen oxidase